MKNKMLLLCALLASSNAQAHGVFSWIFVVYGLTLIIPPVLAIISSIIFVIKPISNKKPITFSLIALCIYVTVIASTQKENTSYLMLFLWAFAFIGNVAALVYYRFLKRKEKYVK